MTTKMKIQVIPKSVSVATSGTNARGKWTLWKITGEVLDGDWDFTTLDGKYAQDIKECIGNPIMVEYDEVETAGKNGRVFINRRLITPGRKETPTISAPKMNDSQKLDATWKMVAAIYKKVVEEK